MATDLHDGPMPLDYNFWILHNSTRTVLVDCGFSARAAAERGRTLDIDPVEALTRLGLDPDGIEDVILTHLHYDHAGNIGRFAKAKFHVQDKEVEFATGRCMCEKFVRAAYDVEDIAMLVRHIFAERMRFHDGDVELLPGLRLCYLPGHTKGIQAVRVATPRGLVVLASDVSHYYANLLLKSPFSIILDVADTLRSYNALLGLVSTADHIVPGHDPLIRSIYPMLDVAGIRLAALHKVPQPVTPAMLAQNA